MISDNEKHRVMLVNPPHYRLYKDSYSTNRYPSGLGYLASAIKKETDWELMVYNADFVPNSDLGFSSSYVSGVGFENYLRNLRDLSGQVWIEIKTTLAEYMPTVVGIYCCAASFVSATAVARLVKDICRQQVTVIVGGPHPTAVGEGVMSDPNIDVAVMGEGEKTIVETLKAIQEGKSLDEVNGVVFKKDNEIVRTPARQPIEDLDSLGFPHKSAPDVLKDYDKYQKSAFRDVYVSRGCPYNCFFCGSRYMWSRNVRFRSVENVVEEIKSLQKMGLKWIEFGDDTFCTDKEYLHQLCDSLARDCHGVLWGCLTRANLIDEETVVRMKKAGCRSIDIGIESGNNEMLKKIRKGITIEQALTAADIITKHGIRLTANFIIGFPDETEDTLNDTFMAMKKIKGLLIYNIFTPYPGTEAFDLCKKAGLIDETYDIALYNHQSPENCFCKNIPKARFRELAMEIERYVDRHNAKQDMTNIFSFSALHKIHDYGFAESLRKLASAVRSL
jgi:anaerobic magnesium-protoporphyrin IX monomethyl ester cyclase